MRSKNNTATIQTGLIRSTVITGVVLSLVFLVMQISSGINWTQSDFVAFGILVFGAAMAYHIIRNSVDKRYRVGTGIIVAILFVWLYVELAVGLFTNWGS